MPKPIFDQPYGLKFQTDGCQMALSWRTGFGAEKTAALQKAQFATAQKAARLIDPYVTFDTGALKNSVQAASRYEEGLLVYNTPYAQKQYYLHKEGADLHGDTKLRGSYWGQRALDAHKDALAAFARNAADTYLGGGA